MELKTIFNQFPQKYTKCVCGIRYPKIETTQTFIYSSVFWTARAAKGNPVSKYKQTRKFAAYECYWSGFHGVLPVRPSNLCIIATHLTFWQLRSIGSTGVALGWVTLTSSLPHSRLDHSSVISALMKPRKKYYLCHIYSIIYIVL